MDIKNSADIESASSVEIKMKGISASKGYAIGPAYIFKRNAIEVDTRIISKEEIESELEKLKASLEKSEKELRKISSITSHKLGEEFSAIFEAHIMMLYDQQIISEIRKNIADKLICAEESTNRIFDINIDMLRASNDAYLSQRADDLVDVKFRIIRNLQRGKLLSRVDEQTIIISDNLTPADMILFSRQNILGISLDFGGVTSHVSLISRSLDIPLIIGLHKISSLVNQNDMVIIDGIEGVVIIRPTEKTLTKYRKKAEKHRLFCQTFMKGVEGSAVTLDGHDLSVVANIEFRDEIEDLKKYFLEGLGLFRTEHLFLSRGDFPSEEDQIVYYSKLIKQVGELPVTIRAFDVGGDKVLATSFREMNPFLGWRGIRILLDRPDIFKAQVRAVLRASVGHNVKLMFPMVHNLSQVRQIKKLMSEIYKELDDKETPFQKVPIGVMIEVPSAVAMADEIAREVDFFSIGTNDLTQYTLAVDRGNDLISVLYKELEPAVIRLIHQTIKAGKKAKIPVSMCGELASNSLAVPLLIGLGLDEFSIVVSRAPEIKYIIHNIKYADCKILADEVLKLSTLEEVESHLRSWMIKSLPQLSEYV